MHPAAAIAAYLARYSFFMSETRRPIAFITPSSRQSDSNWARSVKRMHKKAIITVRNPRSRITAIIMPSDKAPSMRNSGYVTAGPLEGSPAAI